MQKHDWSARLPEASLVGMARNLRRNWFFPVSALAYFLSETRGAEYAVQEGALALVFLVLCAVSTQSADLWRVTRTLPWYLQFWALLSAAGAAWHCYAFGAVMFPGQPLLVALAEMLGTGADLSRVLAVCCGLGGFPFLYVGMSYLWSTLWRLAGELRLFADLHWAERVLYALMALGFIGFAAWAFFQSTGFYSATNEGYDIVYTADTDSLFNNMAYLALTYVENDLRQPLFAIFAAPFAGVPYLLTQLFGASLTVLAVLLNSVQILMICGANLMLASLATKSPVRRAVFMLALGASYTTLLNTLMLEQYVTAYFWLMLAASCICTGRTQEWLGFYGATGSLLTNVALAPWFSAHNPLRSPLRWLGDMVKLGLSFIVVMLAFARFDVIWSVVPKLASLVKFTGGDGRPFADRVRQFVSFVHDCFLSPVAGVSQGFAPDGILSWRLAHPENWNLCGLVLLALMFAGFLLSRRNRLSQLALYWTLFSFVLLAVIGWGTWESGLILYALYFGWAYFLLLFRLIEKIAEKLHAAWLTLLVLCAATALMLWDNLPGIGALIDYCITYFPL